VAATIDHLGEEHAASREVGGPTGEREYFNLLDCHHISDTTVLANSTKVTRAVTTVIATTTSLCVS
jgi:hypothetical protein